MDSLELHVPSIANNCDGIFKLLRSPGIDSKESIPPAYVAWRAGATTLFLFGSWHCTVLEI
jgi:hypothetical protein